MKKKLPILVLFLFMLQILSIRINAAEMQENILWKTVHKDINKYKLLDVAYNGKTYVAVGIGGYLATSSDAENWIEQDFETTSDFCKVIWDGNLFAVEDINKTVISSEDGVNWKIQNDYKFVENSLGQSISKNDLQDLFGELRTIIYNGEQYVAYNSNFDIFVSNDALKWDKLKTKMKFFEAGIVWGNNKYIAVDSLNGKVFSSLNGIGWTESGSAIINECQKVVWTGNLYIACGKGEIWASADGEEWENHKLPEPDEVDGIAWNGNQFVLINSNNTILASKNFSNWNVHQMKELHDLSSVFWDGKEFVVLGSKLTRGIITGCTVKSVNGLQWKQWDAKNVQRFLRMIWTGDQFIGTDGFGNIVTSSDGINWSRHKNMAVLNYRDCGDLWDGEKVVMVGWIGTIILGYPMDIIKVKIDGKPIVFDVAPIIKQGTTLVPLRAIFEKLGAEVKWDAKTRTITGTKGSKTVILKLDDTLASVDGQKKILSVPATSIKGRTMVPARFISESLGANVGWDGITRTCEISSI
ncbi:MAG TPA: stalk domain-containing protein [Pseudobacteroides sp.]|uniref:stalk domain-containing protein n=1 Tax=Pseudobacteroides sp. TaxID=1968840 RepID=UPI002F93A4D4